MLRKPERDKLWKSRDSACDAANVVSLIWQPMQIKKILNAGEQRTGRTSWTLSITAILLGRVIEWFPRNLAILRENVIFCILKGMSGFAPYTRQGPCFAGSISLVLRNCVHNGRSRGGAGDRCLRNSGRLQFNFPVSGRVRYAPHHDKADGLSSQWSENPANGTPMASIIPVWNAFGLVDKSFHN